MQYLKINNRTISTPILDILNDIKFKCNNGKLKVIKAPKNDNIRVTCPFHKGGQEKRPSSDIYIGDKTDELEYGWFKCFTCGETGPFYHFVAECLDISDNEAKTWLIENYSDATVAYDIDLPPIILSSKSKIKHVNEHMLDSFQSFHPYMIERKISKDIIEKFNIKYDNGFIIFPFYDFNNKFLGVTKRSVEGKIFMIDDTIDKQNNLYLLNNIRNNNITKCAILESQIDALNCYEYGLPAVATLGGITKNQVELLNRSGIRVLYTIFDNDIYGSKFKSILNKYINDSILVIDVKLPNGYKDVNDLNKELFYECIKNAEENDKLF